MQRIKLVLLTLSVSALCACATNSPTPAAATASPSATPAGAEKESTPAELEKTIIDLEKKAWEWFRTKDAEAIRKGGLPGGLNVTATGIEVSPDNVESIKKNISDLEIKEVTFSDWKVFFPVPGTAIVAYKNTNTSSSKGKDTSGTYYSYAIWVKVNGEWKGAGYCEAKAEPQLKK